MLRKSTTTIRAGLTVFGAGFLVLLALSEWTAYEGQKHVHRAADSLFPAALKSQEAASAFQRMTRRYNDAVVLEDKSAIGRAGREGASAIASLEMARNTLTADNRNRRDISSLIAAVAEFQQRSERVYATTIESRGSFSPETQQAMADLAYDSHQLQLSFQQLQANVAADFRTELNAISVWSGRQRVFGIVIFVVVIGAVIFTGYTLSEIMARRRANDALHAAHQETQLLLNSVPSLLIGLDRNARITRWNFAAGSILGMEEADAIGKTLATCGVRWITQGLDEAIAQHLKHPKPGDLDNIRFTRDGNTRFLGLNAIQLRSPDGSDAGSLVVGADITERKVLEEHLRQAQKLEAIGQLAAGVAHEINTPTQYVGDNIAFVKDAWGPVCSLLKELKTIADPALPIATECAGRAALQKAVASADLEYLLDEVPRAIDQAIDGVGRVAKIVRAMKEFSHPGSEEKKGIDLNRAIETTVTVARNECKYVADVVTRFDPDLPLVPCLAGEINQVLLNLLLNAAQAIGEVTQNGRSGKGTIAISTSHDDRWAEIQIQDTGIGIPEQIRQRVFEPFFTTKEVGKGTGQGLALAHTVVVKKHGGQIWFDSEPGKGTTFFIRLPFEASIP